MLEYNVISTHLSDVFLINKTEIIKLFRFYRAIDFQGNNMNLFNMIIQRQSKKSL